MCRNIKNAQFHCYRLFGHTDVGQSMPGEQKHFYNLPDDVEVVEGDVPYVDNENRPRKPLCILYGNMLKGEETNPPAPYGQRPAYIQRLKSRSRNPHIEFKDRYEFDLMGCAQFEQGEWAKRAREFDEVAGLGRTQVGEFTVHFVYNPVNYNEQGAIETIQQIYDRKQPWWIEEDPYFNYETCRHATRVLQDRAVWNAQFITALPHNHIDAWFDIQFGLFWTIDNVNVYDFRENFERTVRGIEVRRRKRDAAKGSAPR